MQRGEGKVRSSGCCAFLAVLRPSPRGEDVSSYLVCRATHPLTLPLVCARFGLSYGKEVYIESTANEWEGRPGALRPFCARNSSQRVGDRRIRKRAPDDDPGSCVSVESYTHETRRPPRAATWGLSLSPENLLRSSKNRTRTDLPTLTCGRRTSRLSHGNFKVPPRCHHPPRPSPSTDISRGTWYNTAPKGNYSL